MSNNETIIDCDELVKIYISDNMKTMALQGLDLQVKKGEMMAIIGKSGSGKSTLLNMIGGLESPTTGTLLVDGRNLATYKEKDMVKYRSEILGFVWQNSNRNLFPYLTAMENVMEPMNLTRCSKKEKIERAEELLKNVGMEAHADKYPSQMSGGEQQRVAIAVALANNPKILLADEPTGAVDTKTSDRIFEVFQNLNKEKGITIIIVTHDLRLAGKVDRVVMISDGKISTEKVKYEDKQYSVLDKAHRVQLSDEVLAEAGIDSNRVHVSVSDGKIVIEREKTLH